MDELLDRIEGNVEDWEENPDLWEDEDVCELVQEIYDLGLVHEYLSFLSSSESIWEEELPEVEQYYQEALQSVF